MGRGILALTPGTRAPSSMRVPMVTAGTSHEYAFLIWEANADSSPAASGDEAWAASGVDGVVSGAGGGPLGGGGGGVDGGASGFKLCAECFGLRAGGFGFGGLGGGFGGGQAGLEILDVLAHGDVFRAVGAQRPAVSTLPQQYPLGRRSHARDSGAQGCGPIHRGMCRVAAVHRGRRRVAPIHRQASPPRHGLRAGRSVKG